MSVKNLKRALVLAGVSLLAASSGAVAAEPVTTGSKFPSPSPFAGARAPIELQPVGGPILNGYPGLRGADPQRGRVLSALASVILPVMWEGGGRDPLRPLPLLDNTSLGAYDR